MNYNQEDISGKTRVLGKEAPSARVYLSDTEDFIIGMMAVNVQLLVSLYDLNEQKCKDFLLAIDQQFKDKKLNLIVIVKNSFEEIENFKANNDLKKATIAQDKQGHFSKMFGVILDETKYPSNLANAAFVIDKEAELKYVNYSGDFETDELFKTTQETIDFKPKGHTHENWMG